MRKGSNSDESIIKDCWTMNATVDFRKAPSLYPKRMPLKYQNIREPVYMPQQVPRSIHDLATNINYLKPKNTQRVAPNARIPDRRPPDVDSLTDTLVRQLSIPAEAPILMNMALATSTLYADPGFEWNPSSRYYEAVALGWQAPLRGTPQPTGTLTRFKYEGEPVPMPSPYAPPTVKQKTQQLVAQERSIMASQIEPLIEADPGIIFQMKVREPTMDRTFLAQFKTMKSMETPDPRNSGRIYTTSVGGMRGGMNTIPDYPEFRNRIPEE